MISLIERGESSPTAVVLEKLATGLGVPLASLFEAPGAEPTPVSRLADQLLWRDPASGACAAQPPLPQAASRIAEELGLELSEGT